MSEQSIRRIYDRYSADVVAACAEGRGKDLHDRFIQALAADYATTVFLKMETILAVDSANHTEAELWTWAQQFPYVHGLGFVESVSVTLTAFGASDEQIRDGETVAAHAYRDRLDELFGEVGPGGCA